MTFDATQFDTDRELAALYPISCEMPDVRLLIPPFSLDRMIRFTLVAIVVDTKGSYNAPPLPG
jgi:hypothetical protein